MTRDEFVKILKNDIINLFTKEFLEKNTLNSEFNNIIKEKYPDVHIPYTGVYPYRYNGKLYSKIIKIDSFPLSEQFINDLCNSVCTWGDETGDYDKYELNM